MLRIDFYVNGVRLSIFIDVSVIGNKVKDKQKTIESMGKTNKKMVDDKFVLLELITENNEERFIEWLNSGEEYFNTDELKKENLRWLKDVLIPFLIEQEQFRWIKHVQQYLKKQEELN